MEDIVFEINKIENVTNSLIISKDGVEIYGDTKNIDKEKLSIIISLINGAGEKLGELKNQLLDNMELSADEKEEYIKIYNAGNYVLVVGLNDNNLKDVNDKIKKYVNIIKNQNS